MNIHDSCDGKSSRFIGFLGEVSEWFHPMVTLPETNSSHLKIGHPERKWIFQPSIFGCELLVSGRVIGASDWCYYRRQTPFVGKELKTPHRSVLLLDGTMRVRKISPRNIRHPFTQHILHIILSRCENSFHSL